MQELKELIEKQNQAIADMRKANDERIVALEKRGHVDPLLTEKVEKSNEAITEIRKSIAEFSKSKGRLGTPVEDAKAEVRGEHSKAFSQFLRRGTDAGLGELQQKALEIAVDASGGYAVPEELDRAIEQIERNNAPMRELCSQMTVGNETYEKLTNLGGATSGWVDENDARTETTAPSLASVRPSFGEVYAMPGAYQKALDDIMFNAEAWLADEVGITFAEQENAAFTSGDGTKKPKGILSYTLAATADATRTFGQIEKVHSTSSGAFLPDTIISLIHALHRNHRKNAQFVTTTLGVAALRKLKDTTNQYLWQPSLQASVPATLFGYPVIENDDMPVPAADANAMLFGDFKRAYCVFDVRGVRVLRDPYTSKGKVLFYSTKRVGGGVMNDRAVKVYTLST